MRALPISIRLSAAVVGVLLLLARNDSGLQAECFQEADRTEKLERRVAEDQDRIEKLEKKVAELELHIGLLEGYLKLQDPKFAAGMEKALTRAKVTMCANNLRQLWTLETFYMSKFGGRMKALPSATGSAFWLALTKTEPPIINETALDVLVCPFSGQKPRNGFTTYRGPIVSANRLAGGDVVGCCEAGHHPDGTINVLKKSGDVVAVGPSDPLYKIAIDSTSALSVEEKK
jgi:hypothetical protein